MHVVNWVMAGLALISSAGWARAQFNYVSQSRGVSAMIQQGPGPGDSDPGYNGSDSAPGFDPFNRSVGGSNSAMSASASQNSILDPFAIFAYCRAGAGGMNGYVASASTQMIVTFTIESATPYHFHGDYNIYDGGAVRLYNNASNTNLFNTASLPRQGTVNQIGVLEAGTYSLNISYSNSNYPGPDPPSGYGTLTLAIPTPGAAIAFTLVGIVAGTRRRRS